MPGTLPCRVSFPFSRDRIPSLRIYTNFQGNEITNLHSRPRYYKRMPSIRRASPAGTLHRHNSALCVSAAILYHTCFSVSKAFRTLNSRSTDTDGRCTSLMQAGSLNPGMYRLTFLCGEYFEKIGQKCFFPLAQINFVVEEGRGHFHVPLLISNYSYSTYRGS